MEADLSQLDSGLMPEAMDKYYGLRYPAPATLLDHLDSPLFVLDEVGGIRDAQKATEFRRGEELTGLLEEGVLCPGLDVLYQTMDDLVFAAQKQSTLLCENFLRPLRPPTGAATWPPCGRISTRSSPRAMPSPSLPVRPRA